ncbi:MAG: transketolase C-terminal domain-containing protein [Candidatus Paceibacterota bacterium]
MNFNLVDTLYDAETIAIEKMRDGAGKGVAELGAQKDDVVVLGADTMGSSRAKYFAEQFPERTVQVGVAEQNLIGVTAGFAYYGKVPYAFTYAPFLIGRPWEPIRTTLCYPNNHAVLVASHAGLATGPDGPTHQMTEDIALTRCLPNMTVLCPADFEQARKAVKAAYDLEGPVYVRTAREGTEAFTTEDTPFEVGKAQVLREGSDLTAIGNGYMVYRLLQAAEQLKDELSIEVINLHTIKPFDNETVIRSAEKTGKVFTAEDHNVVGGMGSAVAEVLGHHRPVPLQRHGVLDRFAESGSSKDLWKKYNLDTESVIDAIRGFVTHAATL